MPTTTAACSKISLVCYIKFTRILVNRNGHVNIETGKGRYIIHFKTHLNWSNAARNYNIPWARGTTKIMSRLRK